MRGLIALMAGSLLLLSGCGTLYMDAPPGVKLLPEDAPTSVRVERKVWFWAWGAKLVGDADPHAETLVAENDLGEVRITTTNDWKDAIIGIPCGIVSFARRTIVVEGNPR